MYITEIPKCTLLKSSNSHPGHLKLSIPDLNFLFCLDELSNDLTAFTTYPFAMHAVQVLPGNRSQRKTYPAYLSAHHISHQILWHNLSVMHAYWVALHDLLLLPTVYQTHKQIDKKNTSKLVQSLWQGGSIFPGTTISQQLASKY